MKFKVTQIFRDRFDNLDDDVKIIDANNKEEAEKIYWEKNFRIKGFYKLTVEPMEENNEFKRMQELAGIQNESQFHVDKNKKGAGRRFIPQTVTLSGQSRDRLKSDLKLMKGGDGNYKVYLSPTLAAILSNKTGGRGEYIKGDLAQTVAKDIPSDIKLMFKKTMGKINSSINLVPVNVKIQDVKDNGDVIFLNPGNERVNAMDPVISEGDSRALNIIVDQGDGPVDEFVAISRAIEMAANGRFSTSELSNARLS